MLFVAVLAAEAASCALAHVPSSEGLWYINLRWFGIFQKSHYVISTFFAVEYFQLLFIALPMFVAGWCGCAFKRPLLLAIASNLSLIYAIFLLCCWHVTQHSSREMPFGVMSLPSDIELCSILLGACMFSVAVSHSYYFRALRGH